MINRDWFCLALRLFGIWLLIQAIEQFVPLLLYVISGSGPSRGFSYAVTIVFWLVGRSVIGLVLLFFAPAIAARFYPSASSSKSQRVEDEVNFLKIGMQLLGVYALLLAVQYASRVIVGYLSGDGFSLNAGGSYFASLVTFGLNLAFAAILIIWNEQVVTLLAKFRYVPERDAYEPPPLDE